MAKKLIINCGDCDARNVREETLTAYESITINAGDILVTPESKALLYKHNVTMNCADVLELPMDAQLRTINGSAQIKSTDTVPQKTYLQVNGSLEIGPGSQKVLEQYAGVSVNGAVYCPESVSGYLGKLNVNGSVSVYPDEAIVLKRTAVIDKTFVLRAKERLYWSAKRMIMVDPELDGAALAAKGVRFSTREVLLAQSKVEELIDLIDERADIVILPDGTKVLDDDAKLSDTLLRRYGTKLYIQGDLVVPEESGEALARLEYLNVRGDVKVAELWKERLLEKAEEITGEVEVLKGLLLKDKLSLRISRELLERETKGVWAEDCVRVKIDPDVPEELLLERLTLRDCVMVYCTAEQETAIGAISTDVVNVYTEADEKATMGGLLDGVKGILDLDTKVINAGDYVL